MGIETSKCDRCGTPCNDFYNLGEEFEDKFCNYCFDDICEFVRDKDAFVRKDKDEFVRKEK